LANLMTIHDSGSFTVRTVFPALGLLAALAMAGCGTTTSSSSGGGTDSDAGGGSSGSTSSSSGSTSSSGGSSSGTSGTTSSGPHAACDAYLSCVAAATPSDLASEKTIYGPSGTCWTAQDVPTCETRCKSMITDLHDKKPLVAECGKSTVAECLACDYKNFTTTHCKDASCIAIITCAGACTSEACIKACIASAAHTDQVEFMNSFFAPAMCDSSLDYCYGPCGGVASFLCPALGETVK